MALVVLVSAKGAPGVTTLAVALAALTPGAVAADLDPDGGDLGLRYRRPDGAPLDAELGLLSLAAGLRRDLPGRWLPPVEADPLTGVSTPEGPTRLEDHLQVTGGGLDLLLGVNGPEQASGLGPLWSPLARALSEAGRTIYADCGRAGPAAPTMPVLHQADAIIVVARPEVEELAHLRERLRFLNSAVPGRFAGRAQIGVVLVAQERDRAVAGRTEQLLHSSGVGVPVLGTMAEDRRGAEALRGMNRVRLSRSTLIRSVRSLLPSVSLLAGTIPELTAPTPIPVRIPAPAPMPTPQPETPAESLFTERAGKTVEPIPAPVPIPAATPAPAPSPAVSAPSLAASFPDPIGSAPEPIVEMPAAEVPALPMRRRSNSFFGDAPSVEEDPTLLPMTVAPGVFTPPIQIAPEIPTEIGDQPVRGFAGLTTPPKAGSAARSRRAAFGRDPGTLHTSERRRSRRHVMPADGDETSYEAESYGNGVGTWLQANQQNATEASPGETRPRTEGDSRTEGTGWIAPDVPPTALFAIPSALSSPAADRAARSADPAPAPSADPAPPLSADQAAVLRDIRDRARLGADGSGTWAGHTGNTGPQNTIPDIAHDIDQDIDQDINQDMAHGIDRDLAPAVDHDVDTAVLRTVRDPYEPLGHGTLRNDTPDGGR